MKYIAIVCARGGSKGVPGKNIRLLGGRPLIGWSVQAAKSVERISKIIVSTDSEEIAQVAIEEGALVPFMRPDELAQDNSSEWLVWRHALNYLKENGDEDIDGLVIIPSTAPLRSAQDIENCLDEFEKGNVDVVITVSDAHRSPFFNMIKNDKDGFSSLVIPPTETVIRRQDAPDVYDMTTVAYVVRPDFVLQKNGLFEGSVRSVHIPPERALDIDTMLDFKIAECLISEKQKAVL
jgi:CMP-N-acetylneuraminic acid synthetase